MGIVPEKKKNSRMVYLVFARKAKPGHTVTMGGLLQRLSERPDAMDACGVGDWFCYTVAWGCSQGL